MALEEEDQGESGAQMYQMAREIAAALLKAADEAQGGPHGETSH